MAEGRTAYLGSANDAVPFFSSLVSRLLDNCLAWLYSSCDRAYRVHPTSIRRISTSTRWLQFLEESRRVALKSNRFAMILNRLNPARECCLLCEKIRHRRPKANLPNTNWKFVHRTKRRGFHNSGPFYGDRGSPSSENRPFCESKPFRPLWADEKNEQKYFLLNWILLDQFIGGLIAAIFQGQEYTLKNLANFQGALFVLLTNMTIQNVFGVVNVSN